MRSIDESLGRRSFSQADQEWFASASGDHNPLHLDPIAARRTIYGKPVVHGLHAVLWSLEALCRHRPLPICALSARFAKPIFVGDELRVITNQSTQSASELRIMIDDVTLASVGLRHEKANHRNASGHRETTRTEHARSGPAALPLDRTIEQLAGLRGSLAVPGSDDDWCRVFPTLTSVVGAPCVMELAALSTIVGMECPGLHSIFGGFDVRLEPGQETAEVPTERQHDASRGQTQRVSGQVDYSVERADERYSVVKIDVHGEAVQGTLTAFVRPRPTPQPTTFQMSSAVAPGEFEGTHALVVGGSRGLGEVAAKLIAAGGGRPTITWHQGRTEADSVVLDIQSAGGNAQSMFLDVNGPLDDLKTLENLAGITHLLYFASPRISERRLSSFDRKTFDQFVDFYVTGFLRVADAVRGAANRPLTVLYPSSVFVTNGSSDLPEYVAAKAAGEVAAASWATSHNTVRLLLERLPPLATDQTAAFVQPKMADTAATVLTVLRNLHDVAMTSAE